MTTIPTNAETAKKQAAALRRIADMLEAHPELVDNFDYLLRNSGLQIHLRSDDKPAELATIARAGKAHGAKVSKEIDEKWHNVSLDFDGVKVVALAYRNEVCERVVTGTETVTRKVRDEDKVAAALAEIPEVEVTEEVETYEWRCAPLLAGESA